jgi:hypothetical protein
MTRRDLLHVVRDPPPLETTPPHRQANPWSLPAAIALAVALLAVAALLSGCSSPVPLQPAAAGRGERLSSPSTPGTATGNDEGVTGTLFRDLDALGARLLAGRIAEARWTGWRREPRTLGEGPKVSRRRGVGR